MFFLQFDWLSALADYWADTQHLSDHQFQLLFFQIAASFYHIKAKDHKLTWGNVDIDLELELIIIFIMD